MAVECGIDWREEKCTHNFDIGILKGRDHVENLDVRTCFKFEFREDGRIWGDFCQSQDRKEWRTFVNMLMNINVQ
jgi:hypothetical protein